MKDGEVIRIVGHARERWCEKCQSRYIQYPRLDAIKRKNNISITRPCCIFNKLTKIKIFLNKPWPPIKSLDEVYGTSSDHFETLEEQLERWSNK